MAAPKPKNKGGTGTGRRGGSGNPATLRPFPKGVSGNPGGRPKGVKEVLDLARMESEASIRRLAEIRDNPKTPPMAAVAACNSLLDRAYGRPSISAALAIGDLPGEVGSNGLSTLLGRVIEYKQRNLPPPPPAAPTIPAEPAATTEASAPDPVLDVASAASEPPAEPAARPASPKPTPKEWLDEPPAPKARPSTRPEPTPPPAKPKHSGAPAGFAAFSEQRQAERERLEKLAASRPGRQLTREEFHTADPVASSVQGAPEHVAFTLAGHGRIKRVAG